MARIGYARVSTADQNPQSQIDALHADGCAPVFVDYASGVLTRRSELTKALDVLAAGDEFVVWKLDRLGRSVTHLKEIADELQERGVSLKVITQGIDTNTPGGRLFFHMLAAIAEFERDLISERTKAGLAAARDRGAKGGRPSKMTTLAIRQAQEMIDSGSYPVQEVARAFGVSRATLYRSLRKGV